MILTRAFTRLLFFVLSLIFMLGFALGTTQNPSWITYLWGIGLGIIVGTLLLVIDLVFKKFNLRSFNVAILGLFFGYLMAMALILIFNAILDITNRHPNHIVVEVVKIFLFLFGTYLGVMMTLRASDEIYVSLPFIKFTPTAKQVKDLLADLSALSDVRLIDLAASGLLDKRLVIPRFILKELQQFEDSSDENSVSKGKRALEVIRKLETLPDLHLRYNDTDFLEVKESFSKAAYLAKLLDADVLSSDASRMYTGQSEGVKIINIHSLAHALKPLMQKGEFLKIKIQRYGKEELQGIGYLEDGTMVVVNGGGGFIGETITARVLSVKHTISGRMIFCNVAETDDNIAMPFQELVFGEHEGSRD